jgi:uncharacterized alkaline shock family protein YloU
MTIKDKVKKEIDKMPEDTLKQVYIFIKSIKFKKTQKKEIHTFKLNGQFDNVNIREKAYE